MGELLIDFLIRHLFRGEKMSIKTRISVSGNGNDIELKEEENAPVTTVVVDDMKCKWRWGRAQKGWGQVGIVPHPGVR